MPEGHTIHRLARDHSADLKGRVVRAGSPQGRFAQSAERIDGRALVRAEAWGKHLFHFYEGGTILHVHLGLIGKWRRHDHPAGRPSPEARLRLTGDQATWDLAGPQICRLVIREELREVVARLGPDPLRRDADPQRFVDRVRRSDRPIGALLLDQAVIAGVGNVYRAEVLFLHGIHPETPGRELDEEQLLALWHEIAAQLKEGVRRNRIVTLRPEDRPRHLGRAGKLDVLYVYHQESCRRCGTRLQQLDTANRRIDVCPVCQPR